MAAGMMAAPGTSNGPCVDACAHRDCAATRQDATTECAYCKDPIGYNTRFYRIDGRFVHALCMEKRLDTEEGQC
jgi:hypothetical protein